MSKKQLAFGLILILIGSIFLLQTMDIIWISIGDIFQFIFPLGLIFFGLWLIIRKRQQEMQTPPPGDSSTNPNSFQKSSSWDSQPPPPPPDPGIPMPPPASEKYQKPGSSQSSYSSAKTKYSNFLGDLNITCDNVNMRNVEVSAFLGDIEVILRQAKLEPGLSRMVISGFIGDVRIMVPPGLAVFVSGSNFVGDMDLFGRRADGFGNSIDGQTANYETAEKKLYLAINTFIGDIRIIEV